MTYRCNRCRKYFSETRTLGEGINEAIVSPCCLTDNFDEVKELLIDVSPRTGKPQPDYMTPIDYIRFCQQTGNLPPHFSIAKPNQHNTGISYDTSEGKHFDINREEIIPGETNRIYQSIGRTVLNAFNDMCYPDRGPGNYGC